MTNSLARPSLLALTVSFSMLGAAPSFAAEEMDHSAMGHGSMEMDSAPSADPMPGMDHAHMDHSKMDHGSMQGMDHGAMDHSMMNHGSDAPTTTSRTPIPVLTDADRQAAFPPLGGHQMHDSAINSFFLLDKLEYQDADEGSALAWEASGWVGGDINRLWIRSEGERTNGVTEDAELQLLYGRSVSPWWDVVAGVRQDFQPGSPQTWGAFGIQGMALYDFEAEATAFIGENGQAAARLEGEYDILLTNRLILQPTAEANFYGKNDPERGVGSGLANTEVGLRLRYEIVRQFAPYIGVTWNRSYGKTADLIRDEGGDVDEARFVAGIRLWF
ncbi:copper resistance protein B [Pseudomonas sp. LRP2-20]|uniref:copper resistance protein B n=1 Tax=Pseudomonas sp. LRP2-20 TaxID=2944234 RepID=UPI002184ED0D|nr:copper resistance protein B [Pseudomonas sp. LRP2-20]BDM25022.1 copper resistance protein B [Pseudomonas sp. LRP2-20]